MNTYRSWQIAMIWTAVSSLALRGQADGGDWPQILGLNRDGEAVGEELPDEWNTGSPKRVWATDLGEGFAGPAVSGDRVVVFHRFEGKERLEMLQAATGKRIWMRSFAASYSGGVNADRGPRCVPTIVGERVLAFGAAGDLHCVALPTGEPIWTRSLYSDFGGDLGYFGAGSSPLAVGEIVVVNVGGRSAGMVGLSLVDGSTQWQTTKEGASYSSPTVASIAGQRRVICVTRMSTIVLDPADGHVVSRVDFGRKGPTVNAATPLVIGNHVFVTSSYGIGSRWFELKATELHPTWSNDTSMSSQYVTSIHREGFLYGIHGREDGEAHLRCVDVQTGEVKWSVDDFGVAHLILAGNKMLVLKTNGELYLARTNPQKFEPLAKSQVAKAITRALPALSNGQLYFRTNEGDSPKLIALELR